MCVKKNGFSLTETIIYLSLTVILFHLSLFSTDLIERQKIICCVRKIKNDLRYCQKNAMDENKGYEINMPLNQNFYEIKKSTGLGTKVVEKKYFSAGIKCEANNFPSESITYGSPGTIKNGGTIKISGKKYSIEIKANVSTGRVKIEQLQKNNLQLPFLFMFKNQSTICNQIISTQKNIPWVRFKSKNKNKAYSHHINRTA